MIQKLTNVLTQIADHDQHLSPEAFYEKYGCSFQETLTILQAVHSREKKRVKKEALRLKIDTCLYKIDTCLYKITGTIMGRR